MLADKALILSKDLAMYKNKDMNAVVLEISRALSFEFMCAEPAVTG